MVIWEEVVRIANNWERPDGGYHLIACGEENLQNEIISFFTSIGYKLNQDVFVHMGWSDSNCLYGYLAVSWNDDNGLNLETFAIKEDM